MPSDGTEEEIRRWKRRGEEAITHIEILIAENQRNAYKGNLEILKRQVLEWERYARQMAQLEEVCVADRNIVEMQERAIKEIAISRRAQHRDRDIVQQKEVTFTDEATGERVAVMTLMVAVKNLQREDDERDFAYKIEASIENGVIKTKESTIEVKEAGESTRRGSLTTDMSSDSTPSETHEYTPSTSRARGSDSGEKSRRRTKLRGERVTQPRGPGGQFQAVFSSMGKASSEVENEPAETVTSTSGIESGTGRPAITRDHTYACHRRGGVLERRGLEQPRDEGNTTTGTGSANDNGGTRQMPVRPGRKGGCQRREEACLTRTKSLLRQHLIRRSRGTLREKRCVSCSGCSGASARQ